MTIEKKCSQIFLKIIFGVSFPYLLMLVGDSGSPIAELGLEAWLHNLFDNLNKIISMSEIKFSEKNYCERGELTAMYFLFGALDKSLLISCSIARY